MTELVFRDATVDDVPLIVAMYADDVLEWAAQEAPDRGCAIVQLTTNVERGDARRFYERLGFQASHVGMKLALDH